MGDITNTSLAAAPDARTAGRRRQKLSSLTRLPLYYRVLIINLAVVVLGGVIGSFGAWLLSYVLSFSTVTHFMLIGGTIAIVAAVNLVLLRYAFAPLNALKILVRDVRAGDLRARADATSYHDPDFAEFGQALNAMLEALEQKSETIEADKNRIRALTARVIGAQEEERKRVARELHDDTGQLLTALILRIDRLIQEEDCSEHASGQLLQLKEQAQSTLKELRRVMLELRPAVLDDLGLVPAVRWYLNERVEHEGIRTELDEDGLEEERLSSDLEITVFRIIQESLTNIVKHAKASHVRVSLRRNGGVLNVLIEDNGCGFDTARVADRAAAESHLGIFGMEERAALVNGELNIRSSNTGTLVQAAIPFQQKV
ncbi:MAG: sensor histidine kinase [Armatimonadetes bacterium]|nr:sensor histidine kinase [Armatimonadota bacterium]